MTRPKLVAFDLDDTLIGSDGKIAPANFCALEQLSAAGRWCPMRCTAMALPR